MKWIKKSLELPKDEQLVLINYRDEWKDSHFIVAQFLISNEIRNISKAEINSLGKEVISITTITQELFVVKFFKPTCSIGKWCSDENINIDNVDYWCPFPELPKDSE